MAIKGCNQRFWSYRSLHVARHLRAGFAERVRCRGDQCRRRPGDQRPPAQVRHRPRAVSAPASIPKVKTASSMARRSAFYSTKNPKDINWADHLDPKIGLRFKRPTISPTVTKAMPRMARHPPESAYSRDLASAFRKPSTVKPLVLSKKYGAFFHAPPAHFFIAARMKSSTALPSAPALVQSASYSANMGSMWLFSRFRLLWDPRSRRHCRTAAGKTRALPCRSRPKPCHVWPSRRNWYPS